MSAWDQLHEGYVHQRRSRRISEQVAELLDDASRSLLDVGCGDGIVGSAIGKTAAPLDVHGVDVLVREECAIPVTAFDGAHLPHDDDSFDHVLLVDVLHHTEDPRVLLRESARVARRSVLLKDHLCDGLLARQTLRFMDRAANSRHGIVLPFNYWRRDQWLRAFDELQLIVAHCETSLGLYPWPASWLFDRSLHFLASLRPATSGSSHAS